MASRAHGTPKRSPIVVQDLPPPRPPAPRVSDATLAEVRYVMNDLILHNLPFRDEERSRRADDTSSSYQRRIGSPARKHALFSRQWRYYVTSPYADAYNSELSRAIRGRGSSLTMEWECIVYDVQPWPRAGADNVLCSTDSLEHWDFAVVGVMPNGESLRHADHIKFAKFSMAMPVDDDLIKLRFVMTAESGTRSSSPAYPPTVSGSHHESAHSPQAEQVQPPRLTIQGLRFRPSARLRRDVRWERPTGTFLRRRRQVAGLRQMRELVGRRKLSNRPSKPSHLHNRTRLRLRQTRSYSTAVNRRRVARGS